MKSRAAYWENDSNPRTRQVKFQFVRANKTFVLGANERIAGKIVVFNNTGTPQFPTGVAQAAITIGTSAAGTQVSAGSSIPAATTNVSAPTDIGITRADRTIYVQSAAWQLGTHIVIDIEQYPPLAETNDGLYPVA